MNMQETSQESLLLAIAERDELFEMFSEMFASPNYHKVLMTFESGMKYSEIADDLGIGSGTVSRAFDELEDHGLIREGDDGRYHTMPVLKHPIIQYYYWPFVFS